MILVSHRNVRPQICACSHALAIVGAAMALSACVPVSQEQREDREYRRLIHEREYRAFRDACMRQGKRIIIEARHTVGRDGIPGKNDRYFCNAL